MKNKAILTATLVAGLLGACQSSENILVADYCADPTKEWENVCQLHVEVNGTRAALADTDLKLSEARSIANSAVSAAASAQATADNALASANRAQSTANEARSLAASSLDDLKCQTLTINKTDTGSCPVNYRLMSCNQTRFTHRSGGLSFLREINDQTCRFNSRVLEMKVRCCTVAQNRRQVTYSTPTSRPVTTSRPLSTSHAAPTLRPAPPALRPTVSGNVSFTPLASDL